MTPKGSSRKEGERRGRLIEDETRPRLEGIPSFWYGREDSYMGYNEIVRRIMFRYKVSKSTAKRDIPALVKSGILVQGSGGYRPKEYLAEYSQAVPIMLMQESSTHLTVPLSPYNWVTLHGFPELEELESSEVKRR